MLNSLCFAHIENGDINAATESISNGLKGVDSSNKLENAISICQNIASILSQKRDYENALVFGKNRSSTLKVL